jgi:hypothetical protein
MPLTSSVSEPLKKLCTKQGIDYTKISDEKFIQKVEFIRNP